MSVPQINQTLPPFDELVELAAEDPQAFERYKKEMCEEMICSASVEMQDRLRAQQSHIDLVVSNCKNPTHINVMLMKELSKQVVIFKNALDGNPEEHLHTADIIAFRPKNDDWR